MQNLIEKKILALEDRVEKLEKLIFSTPNAVSVDEGAAKKMSIKEYILSKKANGGTKCTLLVGYYLEKFEGAASFNINDLKTGFGHAKIKCPTNINDKVNVNIRNGHMMEVQEKKNDKKAWVLTATGETYVKNNL